MPLLSRFTIALLAMMPAGAFAIDLNEVMTLAIDNDPTYRRAQASRDAIYVDKPIARAQMYLPMVDLSANTTANHQDIRGDGFGGGDVGYNTRGYQLSVTQPIFHYDRFLAVEQADLAAEQADAEVSAALQDLIVRVTDAYFNVLAALDNVAFQQANEESFGRQLEQTSQRFEVGLIAITDVEEARAAYDSAVAGTIAAENELATAREVLYEIIGTSPADMDGLRGDIDLVSPDPADIDTWTDTALRQNLSLKSAELNTATARTEIRRQSAGHMPTLDLVGGTGYSRTGGQFGANDVNSSSVGLQLNIPVWHGGQISARTRQAEFRHVEALEELERQRRAVQRQTRDAYLKVVSGISQVKAFQQAIKSSQTALEAIEAGVEVGTRTTVDITVGQRTLLDAQRNHARARYDYIINSIRLKQAAGSLSPADLAEVNRWLQ